jgi:hypothetical protein
MRCNAIYLILVVLAASTGIDTRISHGALIFDDFTDPLHIETPEEENVTITSLNVGAFGAERRVAVGTLNADPKGFLDINSLHESQATFVLEQSNATNSLGPLVFQGLLYLFDEPVDFTRNGAYDALLVDFDKLQGSGLPWAVRMMVRPPPESQYRDSWEQSFVPTEVRPEPFTAVYPLARFFSRGGGPYAPPLTEVSQLLVQIMNVQNDDAQWEIRLNSIRLGNLPEGDYKANGLVEQADLDLVLSHWGGLSPPVEWLGDAPNLPIGQAELDRVLANWGAGVAPPDGTAAAAAGVPEPSAGVLALLLGGVATMVLSNRRASRLAA